MNISMVEQISMLLKRFEQPASDNQDCHKVTTSLIAAVFGDEERQVFEHAIEKVGEIYRFKPGRTADLVWCEILLNLVYEKFDEQTDNTGQIVLYTGLTEDAQGNLIETPDTSTNQED